MDMHRDILLIVVLLVIGSAGEKTMIRRSVQVPVDQWQTVKSEIVKDGSSIHNLLFVAQHDPAEADKLKQIADEVNDPDSVNYGNFMTYDEIYQSVLPKTTENGHTLEQWAKTNGLKVTRTTNNKQYIMVEASVDTVERVFQTKLQHYQHIKTGELVLRSTSFVLPSDIDNRMALISGLDHFPTIQDRTRTKTDITQASLNSPFLFQVYYGFGHYQFSIVPFCHDGTVASTSFCDHQFDGFQIYLSGQSEPYNVSVAEAKCEVCPGTSKFQTYLCGAYGIPENVVFCQFYLKQDGSVPLYEPHTFTVRTRFLNKFSDSSKDTSPLEKVFDITPPTLRSLYNVDDSPNATRNDRSRQAIAGFQEYLDLPSFYDFRELFGEEFTPLFGKVYGSHYKNKANIEFETSIDIQYMASMGFRIPTDYISSPKKFDGFLIDFFVQLAFLEQNKKNVVPLVYSISYGLDEKEAFAEYVKVCERQFMMMSATGKTVFVASGDYGSTGFKGKCRKVSIPVYPGSSAYVTSVGATQFVQAKGGCSRQVDGYCLEEVAGEFSSLTGCLVTSGGGFSNLVAQPEYQRKAVQNYLENPKIPLPPDTYFNRYKRAYPDISLAGHQYLIKAFGNADLFFDGTSASSPALAGLVSLIVNRRLEMGMKPLGLLNPILYKLLATNPDVFYDITIGNNSCNGRSPVCCQYSFIASKSWDPLTGVGSINHRKLMEQLMTK